jgi:hypothetical protein
MKDKEHKVLYFSLGFTLIVCILLIIYAAIWGVWINVMPALWPTGPQEITQPDYIVFAGFMLLLKVFSWFLRGKS